MRAFAPTISIVLHRVLGYSLSTRILNVKWCFPSCKRAKRELPSFLSFCVSCMKQMTTVWCLDTISYSFGDQKPQLFHWAKSMVSARPHSPRSSRREISLLFLLLELHSLCFMAHGLLPHLHSLECSIFKFISLSTEFSSRHSLSPLPTPYFSLTSFLPQIVHACHVLGDVLGFHVELCNHTRQNICDLMWSSQSHWETNVVIILLDKVTFLLNGRSGFLNSGVRFYILWLFHPYVYQLFPHMEDYTSVRLAFMVTNIYNFLLVEGHVPFTSAFLDLE